MDSLGWGSNGCWYLHIWVVPYDAQSLVAASHEAFLLLPSGRLDTQVSVWGTGIFPSVASFHVSDVSETML